MACDVFDAFKVATESLDQDVYRNATWQSVWLNLIQRDTYKEGTGLTQTTFTINNIEPASDDEDWPAVALATGTGQGACGTTYNEVPVGFDQNSYVPEQFGLMGPMLCKDDLIFDHKVDIFLRAYVEEITKRARRALEKRFESIYMQLARKVVLGAGYPSILDTAGKPWTGTVGRLPGLSNQALPEAKSTVTIDHLDYLAVELIDAGATNPDSNGFISFGDDGPIFSLYIDPADGARIAKNNAEFRNDIRYGMPSMLMKRIGAARVIKNFRIIPNLRPPRFFYGGTINGDTHSTAIVDNLADLGVGLNDILLGNTNHVGIGRIPITGAGIPAGTFIGSTGTWATGTGSLGLINAAGVAVNATATAAGQTFTIGTAGQYTRIPTYVDQTASGKGSKFVINPQYRNAPFSAAFILSPWVFTSEAVRPRNSAGGVSWNPTNYMGEWMFRTGGPEISSTCANGSDPLNKLGRHFAEYKHAPRPEHPLYGMTIFYKRCVVTPEAVVC